MGELAALYSSSVIVTSDNPRNEDPLSIIKDIVEGFGRKLPVRSIVEPDRKSAIQMAILVQSQAILYSLRGKVMRRRNIQQRESYPFSDLEEAERALFDRQIKRGRKLFSNQFTDA